MMVSEKSLLSFRMHGSPITEHSYPIPVLAMLNTGETINMINMASPGDPSLIKLWHEAQAIKSDLGSVSTDQSFPPSWTDRDIV